MEGNTHGNTENTLGGLSFEKGSREHRAQSVERTPMGGRAMTGVRKKTQERKKRALSARHAKMFKRLLIQMVRVLSFNFVRQATLTIHAL